MVHESFCIDSQGAYLWGIDDFIGDSIDARWNAAGLAGGSAVVVDAQDGGIVRITTDGDTNDNYRIDWADIRSLHVGKQATLEFRVKLVQTTDTILQLALRYDVNNRIYFQYNSSIDGNFYISCTNGGVPTTLTSSIAADTDYHIFRIECLPTGEVHFYIDDVECANSPITTNIPDDAADYLQPYIRMDTLADAEKSVDVDYAQWRQNI